MSLSFCEQFCEMVVTYWLHVVTWSRHFWDVITTFLRHGCGFFAKWTGILQHGRDMFALGRVIFCDTGSTVVALYNVVVTMVKPS